jgi:hypothetical protein
LQISLNVVSPFSANSAISNLTVGNHFLCLAIFPPTGGLLWPKFFYLCGLNCGGHYTTFIITLPIAKKNDLCRKPKKTILLVDDERNILLSLERVLHEDGYEIFIAINAQNGLELLAQHSIQVVISNHRMR